MTKPIHLFPLGSEKVAGTTWIAVRFAHGYPNSLAVMAIGGSDDAHGTVT
jgi:hypothetical protein